MSYLDRIREANTRTSDDFLALEVDGRRLGSVRPAFAERLAAFAQTFAVDDVRVTLAPALAGPDVDVEHRSRAVAEVLQALREQGLFGGWYDEPFPATERWASPAAFLIERAAVPHFGVGGFGVHLNGWLRRDGDIHMWVARRSRHKPTWPGLLDQLAAGGQPAGIGLRENMMKECREEADIPPEVLTSMRPVGALTYVLETDEGLRPDILYTYDLELPEAFEPRNTDGEVEAFELLPIDEVARLARDGAAFKFNCALVVIDFLIRHGVLTEDEPDYVQIVAGLRRGVGDPPP